MLGMFGDPLQASESCERQFDGREVWPLQSYGPDPIGPFCRHKDSSAHPRQR